uniref:Uncharacterized protein n=1 Tax=viral metagenome TaxID=1070528 RepID=A0A6C0BWI2_9ZZZZ
MDDFVEIDPIRSIPAKDAIVTNFEKLLSTIKKQLEQLYNFTVSPDFKRIEQTRKTELNELKNNVISKLMDQLIVAIDAFKLLGMSGGGFMSRLLKRGTQISLSDTETLLSNLEDNMSDEFIKFNALLNMIVTYTNVVDKNEQSKSRLLFDLTLTKMETFNSIIKEIINIIQKYNNIPSKNKVGGRKHKRSKTIKHNTKSKSIKRKSIKYHL